MSWRRAEFGHMNYLDAAMLVRIENDLTRRLVEEWKVDLQTLFYDTTNFDTFLSLEKPARLARRGHAKSKRNDLRIVAWRCWSPGIFISRCSRRSTKGIRTTRSPSAEFWTIWSLATECSERNVTASPWFSIRGTIRRKTFRDRKSTRLNSSHVSISYAVFCLKKKNTSPVIISLTKIHKPMLLMTI